VLREALTAARSIAVNRDRVDVLGALTPPWSGNLLQQGFEELLNVLPRCERKVSLFAVSSCFPFVEGAQGPKGAEEVRRAIIDTAHSFP
jgi:hypothetical protein